MFLKWFVSESPEDCSKRRLMPKLGILYSLSLSNMIQSILLVKQRFRDFWVGFK